MIKGISFDIGGTLLDIKGKTLFQKLSKLDPGIEKHEIIEAMRSYLMAPNNSILVAAEQYCNRLNIYKSKEKVIEILFSSVNEPVCIYNEAETVLSNLKTKGYYLAVISNNHFWNANEIFGSKLRKYFDVVLLSSECGIVKPDIKIFKMMEEKLNLSGSQILHVGDSLETDYFGAINAGWNAVFLDRKNKISRIQSRLVTLSELPNYLERMVLIK